MPATLELLDRTQPTRPRAVLPPLVLPPYSPADEVETRSPRIAYDTLARTARWAWAIAFGFAVLVAPAYAADVPRPAWLDVASVVLLVGIVAAVPAALRSARVGWIAYGLLAGVGVAVGIGCREAHHHAPGWWLTETALWAAAAGLCAVCAAAATRRSR